MPHCPKLCGRTGVRWFAAYDRLRTLRDWIWMLTTLRAWIRIRIAVKASVPPRRPGQQNDGSLHEAVQAQWREVVRRARPVDNTARLALDVDNTARLDLDVDNTARLEPVTDPVRASVPPRRPGQQNDGSLREVVRASGRGGEVVRRVRPVDSASRLRKGAARASVPSRRPGQQNDGSMREVVRARGHGGEVVRRARPVDSAARLRRGAVRPSVPPRRQGTTERCSTARSCDC